jgi:hypothetical protein
VQDYRPLNEKKGLVPLLLALSRGMFFAEQQAGALVRPTYFQG